MALILSIETSTTVCSVALTENGERLKDVKIFDEQSHSTRLTLLIEEVLRKAGKKMSDLNAVAVSEGPGSYTGLRIGVSTGKGVCYTLGIPLIAIPTLQAMAYEVNLNNADQSLLVPMIDARRMEVYTATYDHQLEVRRELCPLILDETSYQETLINTRMLFFGNGADKFNPLVEGVANAKFIADISPSAWAIGLLANERFEMKDFANVAYFEPNYLKAYQATTPKKKLL